MLLRVFSRNILYFKLFLVIGFLEESLLVYSTNETEEYDELSTFELPESEDRYYDYFEEKEAAMKHCCQANMIVLAYADHKMRRIPVSFELPKEEFNECFEVFDIFLQRSGEEIASIKIPSNFKLQKVATHVFQNISCGLYIIRIKPCCYVETCVDIPVIEYPHIVNMSCSERIFPESAILELSNSKDYQMRMIYIITIVAVLLMLTITGFAYYYCNSIRLRHIGEKREEMQEEKMIRRALPSEKKEVTFRRIKIYILHYSNQVILENVAILKDFLPKLLKVESAKDVIEIVQIKDELHKILFDRTWWINDALEMDEEVQGQYDELNTLKKVIIVDADKNQKGEPVDTIENENENEIFDEAKTKLGQDWLRSLNDYNRIFVIHFNGLSPIKSKALKFIVPGVRYDIPDNQLVSLCDMLLSGSGFDSYVTNEDIVELIKKHPIKNLGSGEYCYV